MTQTLRLWMLGPWQMQLNGGSPLRLATRNTRVLLARLSLAHPQPIPRTTLLSDLFPQRSAESANERLRATRHYLRQDLGALVVSDAHQLGLEPSVLVYCDYHEFLQKTHSGATESDLIAAIALYRGPLLDASGEGWVAHEAQHARLRYVDALRRLVALARAAQSYATLLLAAQRWVEEEPWDEHAHTAYLEALIAQGDRTAATSHLHRARGLLRDEWGEGAQHSFAELARMIARLPANGASRSAIVVKPVPAPTYYGLEAGDHLPLVGRSAELALATHLWRAALQGQPAGLLIEGASGVGKTRLAQELVAQVRLRAQPSVLWLQVGTQPADRWLQLLEEAVVRLAAHDHVRVAGVCMALDERSWGVLCRYWPRVRALLPERAVAVLPPLVGVAEATRRQAALRALIVQLATAGPLLLVLDDLRQIDPELQRLLATLLQGSLRLLVLATCLPGDGAPLLAAAPVLLQQLQLAPLSASATRNLIVTILGAPAHTLPLERLSELSGGSPAGVLDMLRSLRDQNNLRLDSRGGWQLMLAELPLPQQMHDLLRQRLDRLSRAACDFAALLAVVGRPADHALLAALWPDDHARLDTQAELLRHAVLVEQGDLLQFDHPGLRTHLLEALRPEQRAILHARAAAALHSLGNADRAELMQHYAGAGNWETALDEALVVAESAHAESQLPLLRRALDLCGRALAAFDCPALDARRWHTLRLSEAYQSQAARGAAWEQTLEELMRFATASGQPEWQVQALVRYGLAQLDQGRLSQAEALLRQAAELARANHLHAAETWARLSLGQTLDARGATTLALQEAVAAAAVVLGAEDSYLHMRVLIFLGAAHARGGDLATALALLQGLQTHPLLNQRPLLAMRLTHTLGVVRMGRRDYSGGLAELRLSLQQAQAIGDAYWECKVQTSLCRALAAIGLFSECCALGGATLPMARQIGDTRSLAMLLLSMANALFFSGALEDALPLLREGAALAECSGLLSEAAAHLVLGTHCALALHNHAEAHALLERTIRMGDVVPVNYLGLFAQALLVLKQEPMAARLAYIAAERALQPSLESLLAAATLWEAGEVIATLEGRSHAELCFTQAADRFVADLARLESFAMRRAFLTARPAHRIIATRLERESPRRLVWLPLRAAPTGRPLHADELAPVVWEGYASDDPSDEVERRRCHVQRVAAVALEQGALATVEALAEALAVTPRTIKRDLRALRDVGVQVVTRGTVLGTGRVPIVPQ